MHNTPLPRRKASDGPVSEAAVEAAAPVDTPVHADGPTRHGAGANSWKANTAVSTAIRWTIMLLPSVLSFFVTWSLARVYPAAEVGIPTYSWWICLFALGLVVLLSTERVSRGLLPLAALFKLSLVFPDEAPSRFSVAMRNNSTKKVERRMEEVRVSGFPTDESEYAETMLELVAGLSMHDRMTRGHSERVRAYTDMIAEEMKLSEEDAGKLRWAALLHDVGKIYVPSEILNKPGRPTESEWVTLKSHTWRGDELIEPLKDFLGEWGQSVRNHHERWDGKGYPDSLGGGDIPLGARIVAVADAYDVMTSTRSYKEPRPPAEARAEIAACAGGQFDPHVARAFLNIGLGRLRFAAGPLSWLANVQAATQLPVGTLAQPVFTVATAVAATVAAGVGPATPAEIAFAAPPTAITLPADEVPSTVPTTSTAPAISTPPTTSPNPGPTTPTTGPAVTQPTTTQPTTTQPPVTTVPTTAAPVTQPQTNEPLSPVAETSFVVTAEDQSVSLILAASTEEQVKFILTQGPAQGRVTSPAVSFGSTVTPTNGVAQQSVTFAPNPNEFGVQSFNFSACSVQRETRCGDGKVTVNVTPANDLPTSVEDLATVLEDGSVTLTPALVLANDSDVEGDSMTVRWGVPSGANSVLNNNDLTYVPLENSTAQGVVPYRACDADGCGETAFVTVSVTPVNDQPIAVDDRIETAEDVGLELEEHLVLANDIEVDGDPIRVNWVPNPSIDQSVTPPVYTPPADFNGEVDLTYQLCDPISCAASMATIVMTPVPDAPRAFGESLPAVLEDQTFTGDEATILSNDSDPDGDALSIAWGTPNPPGQFEANASGVVYIPPADFNGIVTIPYIVCDPSLLCSDEVVLALTFSAVDDPPVLTNAASPYVHSGLEDTPSNFTTAELLLAVTDVDTDTADLTVTYTDPADGNFVDNGDGSGFVYTPPTNSTADQSIQYEVCDLATCVPGSITLTFDEVFDSPEPAQIARTLDEDSSVTIQRAALESVANDSDTAPADLTFTFTDVNYDRGHISVTPASGPLTSLTFVPEPDANGPQATTYEVCDNTAPDPNCSVGTINFNITPQPDTPVTTGAPTPKSTPADTPVTLDEDYTFYDADGDTPVAQNFASPDGVAVRLPDNTIEFTPTLGFSGQTSVTFDLCDPTGCTSDPQLSSWEINVVFVGSPSIEDIGEQQVFIGVPFAAGPFAVDNPNSTNLSYVHDLPAGLSIIQGPDEISISGTVTDPALLGTDVLSDITVTDDLGKTSTSSVFFKISATGLSPLEGDVIITEVLAENMSWCHDETGTEICVEAELIEVTNISSNTVDMSTWRIQSHKPGTTPGNGDLVIDIGPGATPAPGVTVWNTTAVAGNGTVFHTRWLGGQGQPDDYTKLDKDRDHVWLLDGDGLIIDYMGWSTLTHLGHDHSDEAPEVELGIWNIDDYGAMAHYSGEYSDSDYTSMSLATRTNANTAACWEFTTSGAASVGTYVCPSADTFVSRSIESLTADHNAGMLMSFYFYN